MQKAETKEKMSLREHWNVMLESWEMRQIIHHIKDQVSKFKVKVIQQVQLSEEFDCIKLATGNETTKVYIGELENVLHGNMLPGWIADNCAGIEDYNVNRCFALKTLGDESCLYLVAPSSDVAGSWIKGLESLIGNKTKLKEAETERDKWLREVFNRINKPESNNKITYANLFKHLNSHGAVKFSEASFEDNVKEFLHTHKRKEKAKHFLFNEEEFIQFYKFLNRRNDIEFVFKMASSNGASISVTDLHDFLTREQNLNVTQQQCRDLIATFEVTQSGRACFELGIDGFLAYMNSKETALFNSAHEKVYQDMTQPLSHYYIASSHNTYLTGHQLKGYSSAQAYRDVLVKGGRCVELDCWDGDDHEPIVYHGHTLTSKIPFKDIILAIKESAFQTSPYPVIVSLENHCSEEGQRKMAHYMVEILGNALYNTPVDFSLSSFPSPEFFKNKIIIRGKKSTAEAEEEADVLGQNGEVRTNGKERPKSGEEQVKRASGLSKQDIKRVQQVLNQGQEEKKEENGLVNGKLNDDHLALSRNSPNTLSPQSSPSSRRRRCSWGKSKKTVAKELSELINYVANMKFRSFTDYFSSRQFMPQSSSFVESEMLQHVKEHALDFVEYNKRLLSRIYPGNLRVESSNYDPVKPWTVGCQIVALNHQTDSEQMHLHYGKFRQNGGVGYVLKPSFLRDPRVKFDPNPPDCKFPGIESKHLRLTVISGQQFPTPQDTWALVRDEPDPYVQVEIHGVPADEVTFTTKGLTDTSFNPIWNDVFETTLRVPELALIRFVVYDADYGFDDFIGQVVIPFESMQHGYRHVQLLDMKNDPIKCASLFVHVSTSDVIET